jgi:hypothetical protein
VTTAQTRFLLAATAIAAVLAYGLSGHGLSQMSAHDGMAGATAGICLLLATVLGLAAAPKPETSHAAAITNAAPCFVDPPPLWPLDGRARASPSALQRFRN